MGHSTSTAIPFTETMPYNNVEPLLLWFVAFLIPGELQSEFRILCLNYVMNSDAVFVYFVCLYG
jgi:hypothetical protein